MIYFWLSLEFTMTFLKLSYHFLFLSHDFLMTLSRLIYVFLMIFFWLSKESIRTFSGLSKDFLKSVSWISHNCLVTFSYLSYAFLRTFSGNARVIFFLALVKLLPKFLVFCRESEECCNFLFHFFWHFMTIYGALWYFMALLWHFMPLFGTFGLVYGLWRIHFCRNLCPI